MSWSIVSKAAVRSRRDKMEMSQNLKQSGVTENTKESCLSAVFWATSWLESVPKIVLFQMTKKLVKNIFSISVDTKDRFKTGLKFSSTFG